LVSQINTSLFPNIKSHIENFTSFQSRYTGYKGYNQSVTYISSFYEEMGLENITSIDYPLLVPLDEGSYISINNETYPVFPLKPNSVHTSNANELRGTLVYGGQGTYQDLDGIPIKESIVVLEFNSGDNWINIAGLGAKGVIFLNVNTTTRFEAEVKSLDIPLDFPRVYIDNLTHSNIIKSQALLGTETISLHSQLKWREIRAQNIYGLISGERDDVIVIASYFDSYSIVPSLAPGADESCGIATQLELIRVLTEMKTNGDTPKYTIMFLALSGHNQAAAGSREFVKQFREKMNVAGGIKLFLTIDLSATSEKIGIIPYGYLYKFKLQYTMSNNLYNVLKMVGEDRLIEYASDIRVESGSTFEVSSFINLQSFENVAPISFLGDQEPFIASNVAGLAYFTAESYRINQYTPTDTPDKLNYNHLRSQVDYTLCSLVNLLITEDLTNVLTLKAESFSIRHTSHVGYAHVEGFCKEFNETEAWLTNVPNALIRVISLDSRSGTVGEFEYITQTDDTGYYIVNGVASSQPDYPLDYIVEAYVFDDSGQMVKAINLGSRGGIFKRYKTLDREYTSINPTVFDCGTIAFFGVYHPYTQELSAKLMSFRILDPETRVISFSYGYVGYDAVSLVFIEKEKPAVVVGHYSDGIMGIYATNSSETHPKGVGYKLKQGQFTNLGISSFPTSRDLLAMTSTYIKLYTSYNIKDSFVDKAFEDASNLIENANNLMGNNEYSLAIVTIKQVQTHAYDAFLSARTVIEDGTSTTIFFAILLIPFAFALSSLLFNLDSQFKQITFTGLIYGIFFFFFYLVHPGLHLTQNIGMIIIGIIATIFIFPALLMIYQEGYQYLQSIRVKMVGAHFADTSRTSTILIAMSTGLNRMKKRKGRTMIALSGIILITFSLTLFTTASTQVSVYAKGKEFNTPYEGVQFRIASWEAPLSENILESIEIQYSSQIEYLSSRWWLYPPSTDVNGFVNITANNATTNWVGWSILGIGVDEPRFHDFSTILSDGSWFSAPRAFECVLSEASANELEVEVNDTVIWAGIEFKIVGIMKNEFDSLKDFDNEELTPKNNRAPSPNVHIDSALTFFIPSGTAKDFGASLYAFSIITNEETSINIAETISTTYGRFLEIRIGFENTVTIYKRVTQSLGKGFVELGMPLTIAILLMINTSISTVYESKREIETFTSLGLAPFHIAGLFLAEFLVYAVIGSVIGYLAGITIAVLLSNLGLFPANLAINYSSGSVMSALGLGMAGILLSTIYPLTISAKMSVPSVKRSWELKTTPIDNNWMIPLPFVAATEKEANGIIEFMFEYFRIYESESVGGVFFAQNPRVFERKTRDRIEKHLTSIINLAPFDVGIQNKFDLVTYLDEIKYRYIFEIHLERTEGILSAWEASVRRFTDVIRKQLLIWRNLPKDQKALKAKEFHDRIQRKRNV